MTWASRFAAALALVVGIFAVQERGLGTPAVGQTVNPHEDPGAILDENCGICHDVPGYEEGAHGDPSGGVYRRPGYPIGDCEHCHDFDLSYPHYLFMPYGTDVEQRGLCLFCHDGSTATAPVEPPAEHAPSSTTACVPCHDPHVPGTSITGVGDPSAQAPSSLAHVAAWPVPYRSGVLNISFATALSAHAGESSEPDLVLFDVSGRLIRALAAERHAPGEWGAKWDGLDTAGRRVAPGIYFLRLSSREQARITKVVVLR